MMDFNMEALIQRMNDELEEKNPKWGKLVYTQKIITPSLSFPTLKEVNVTIYRMVNDECSIFFTHRWATTNLLTDNIDMWDRIIQQEVMFKFLEYMVKQI